MTKRDGGDLRARERRKFIVGNWKMNGSVAELSEVEAIAAAARRMPWVDVAVALPAPLLSLAALRVPNLVIGAQDVDAYPDGAHTGCIPPQILRDVGASFSIVGHSERRRQLRETGASLQRKAAALRASGLDAILCVGETVEDRDKGSAVATVVGQMLEALPQAIGPWLAIAYEPLWAIGTGRTARVEQIEEIHLALRAALIRSFGHGAAAVRLLYGGSVTSDNAFDILSVREVNGVLVGGASLKALSFIPIMAAADTICGNSIGAAASGVELAPEQCVPFRS